MKDHFTFRKREQLKKSDKSLKGNWDEHILDLCNKINLKKDYYTTSSCSGRVVLIKSSKIKSKDLFIKVWHDKIDFEDLKKVLSSINTKDLIYFKQEPVILHIACRTIEDAQKLIDIATKKASWKRCGILASSRRFIVELNSTEKLEFPIFYNEVLVSDNYLKLIVEEANERLKRSWEKIKKLEKLIL